MGFIRKVGKKIAKGIRKVGRKLKKGLGKVARAFGKLGPLGSIALSFILPGIGNAIGTWFSGLPSSNFLVKVVDGIRQGASFIKDGVGTVFNKVTDAIEYGMNAVSKPFMQEGARGAGSAFRDFVSDVTGGFVEKSTVGVEDAATKLGLKPEDVMTAIDEGLTTAEDIRKQAYPELFKDKDFVVPSTGAEIKPDGKPSLLEGKGDQSLKEYVKGSKEYGAYKKIAPVQAFGATLTAQDESVAAYNASLIAAEKDYLSSVAQDVLYTDPLSSVKGSSTPVNFIDINNILESQNPYQAWLQGIYGQNIPMGSYDDYIKAAQGSNNYGFNLSQLGI